MYIDLMILYNKNLYIDSPVVSMIIPIALSLLPAVIAGASDDGTVNIKSNVSIFPSANLSSITGILILLVVIPLSKVTISGVVLKSTPPVSQTLQSTHNHTHYTITLSRHWWLFWWSHHDIE